MGQKFSQILRYFGSAATANIGVGAEIDEIVLTAYRRLLIRGWSFAGMVHFTGNPAVGERCMTCGEITKATARSTNFTLQHANGICLAVGDLAGADNVGGIGTPVANLHAFFSKEEAKELGLTLDYGESIRLSVCSTVAVGGDGGCEWGGVFWYQEIY